MVTIEKLSDTEYALTGSGKSLKIAKELYEDIYFCIPEKAGEYKSEAEFYRQLTDNIAQNQEERDLTNFMLEQEPDRQAALRGLQDQAREMGV